MPFLDADLYGPGPLFTFTAADPFAFLKADVVYYQTDAAREAIRMAANPTLRLTVAGTIESAGYGVRITNTALNHINVTASGYLGGDVAAIFAAGRTPAIVNAGTIESMNGPAILQTAHSGVGGGRITNSGVIRTNSEDGIAIQLSGGNDRIVNTGLIVGDVRLGQGTNRIDTHEGRITGTIYGGNGADTFEIRGTEQVVGGAGIDTVIAWSDYVLGPALENLVLRGEGRIGIGNELDNRITGGSGIEVDDLGLFSTISGFRGDDTLISGAAPTRMFGDEGDDVIYFLTASSIGTGGAGADTFFVEQGGITADGGAGNDFFDSTVAPATAAEIGLDGGEDDDYAVLGAGIDVFDGGSGTDTVDYSASPTGVVVDVTLGVATGGWAEGDVLTEIENLIGTALADTLTGDSLGNRLDGGDGADFLFGNGGGDALVGGLGVDTISGGGGIDLVIGGGGNDVLSGGTERDTFRFDEAAFGSDTITDFASDSEFISFEGSLTVLSFSDLTIRQVKTDTFITTDAGTIRLRGVSAATITSADFVFATAAAEPDAVPWSPTLHRAIWQEGDLALV